MWLRVCLFVHLALAYQGTMLSLVLSLFEDSPVLSLLSAGYGFDRHLFVLKRMADWKEMKLPLFEDPAYAKMNRIILSTSTLSADNVLIGGFAPVVDDGLGVGYNISAQNIGVHLTSYPACRDGEQFLHHVRQCLDEIHEVLTHK